MKVELQSKKFIKPSIPTPPTLANHKISFTDELSPKIYVPLIFYYSANGNNDKHLFSSTCSQLQRSLGHTLVQFYPLAGRYMEDLRMVDCNDLGVEFVEAKVNCQLHDILSQGDKKFDTELLNQFIPCELAIVDDTTDPLLFIQVTMFECGGLAIGVCISHRIADAATLSMFIQAWATANKNQQEGMDIQLPGTVPSFYSAYFPGRGLFSLSLVASRTNNKIVTKKFSFDKNALSTLRAKFIRNGTSNSKPTRVQLVNALIWKALVGVERLKDEKSRASHILQPVNLRERTTPPVPKSYCGNLCTLARVPLMAGENMEVQGLADQLTDSVKGSLEEFAQVMLLGDDMVPFFKNLSSNLVNYYMISSWSRYPFYETDFGWGKPAWISGGNVPVKNAIILMDDKERHGFEAWANLDEDDMLVFQQDCDIQAFTT